VQRPLKKENKRELREETRKRHEKNWLAPAGSERERQWLRGWAKRGGLSQKYLQLIHEWLNNPDEFARRNEMFWHAAKKNMMGPVVYETAMERHQQLDATEWLVAYFTVEGVGQKQIASLTHISERTVDNIIRNLKDKITQDLGCDIQSVEIPQITRWFFGL
jgi:DNA-binding CsgD family transcriptional regulator